MWRRISTTAITLALSCVIASQLVRDRGAVMLLMCVPPWPVALVALGWDVALRGYAWRRRWLLSGVAFVVATLSLLTMWTPARAPEGVPGQRIVRVVQWNTQWGGRHRKAASEAMIDALDAQQPDVVCLSEAPRPESFDPSWRARHPQWHTLSVENPEREFYWYRLTLSSRYPVHMRSEWDLPTGHSALFEVAVPQRPLRILMVDLESSIHVPRTPSIERVAQYLARTPADLVLGDFNAPARFRGFDTLESTGYRRASLWSGAWRATWPSLFPLLDIDHIWVRNGLNVLASRFFRSPGIDHRGQRASLRL